MQKTNYSKILPSGGKMGELTRKFDWTKTALGPIDSWPLSLITAMNIMLQSPVPIVMLWGPNGIMLYNDSYSIFAGKRHPKLLGSKVVEGWPEVADFNRHVMQTVYSEGQTLSYENQQLTLYRNNEPEEVWMNLTYSPILDESSRTAGVLAVVLETTAQILAQRKQAAAENELRAEREYFHTLLMEAPAVIAVLRGPNHVFELSNPFYSEITGHRPMVGKPAREALPELEGQGFFEILDTVYQTGQTYYGNEVRVEVDRTGDGTLSEIYLNFVYQPSRKANGEVDAILVHAIEITDQVAARKKLEQRAQEQQRLIDMTNQRNDLIKLNKAKDEFVALASHQLRTPATAVKQYIGAMLGGYGGELTPQQTKFLQTAYDSNERQLNIINDLLKTAQIDSRQYTLHKSKIDITDLIQTVISELLPVTDMRGQRLTLNGLTGTRSILIDKHEIKLAISNLIENASKYSHPNSSITVSLFERSKFIDIEIIDTGVGLTSESQKVIFDKFTRVDNALSDTVTGTGLGLYWVKKIIKLHKGTIKVKSVIGKGTTFTVRLPI
ncbi:MAG: hypothetical protein NVSMB39_4230 [Candidatus Saccharimonadales bacterium]